MQDKPKLILIAGPNGSGKSTITNHLMSEGVDFGIYVNPDEIAARLSGSDIQRAKHAQSMAEKQRQDLLKGSISHSFESVMSHPSKIEYMVQAKAKGFHVTLVFVGIDDPQINIDRVANRVKQGGHPVPLDKILARYKRTMDLLFDASMTADHAMIFDNSSPDNGMQMIAEVKDRSVVSYQNGVPWLQTHFMDKYNKKSNWQ